MNRWLLNIIFSFIPLIALGNDGDLVDSDSLSVQTSFGFTGGDFSDFFMPRTSTVSRVYAQGSKTHKNTVFSGAFGFTNLTENGMKELVADKIFYPYFISDSVNKNFVGRSFELALGFRSEVNSCFTAGADVLYTAGDKHNQSDPRYAMNSYSLIFSPFAQFSFEGFSLSLHPVMGQSNHEISMLVDRVGGSYNVITHLGLGISYIPTLEDSYNGIYDAHTLGSDFKINYRSEGFKVEGYGGLSRQVSTLIKSNRMFNFIIPEADLYGLSSHASVSVSLERQHATHGLALYFRNKSNTGKEHIRAQQDGYNPFGVWEDFGTNDNFRYSARETTVEYNIETGSYNNLWRIGVFASANSLKEEYAAVGSNYLLEVSTISPGGEIGYRRKNDRYELHFDVDYRYRMATDSRLYLPPGRWGQELYNRRFVFLGENMHGLKTNFTLGLPLASKQGRMVYVALDGLFAKPRNNNDYRASGHLTLKMRF